MCKFNGKSIEVRTINGETVYHGKQTLLAIGYGNRDDLAARTCSRLDPSEYVRIPYGKTGFLHTYWITRAGLNRLAAINAQAPAHCSHTTNWGNFLRQLDEEKNAASVRFSAKRRMKKRCCNISKEQHIDETHSELQLPPMFYKISNLIEEYQEFRDQYMKMQEELRRLALENEQLKRNFAKAREVFTECAAGF